MHITNWKGVLVNINPYPNSSAQSVGVVEYTDCISAKDKTPNERSGYITESSDGEAPVLELYGR